MPSASTIAGRRPSRGERIRQLRECRDLRLPHEVIALRFQRFGVLDVDLPVRQLVGEARILPFLANRKTHLIRRHDHAGDLVRFIEAHGEHLRGGKRLGDERRSIRRPLHHVDLLAVQFGDDILDTHAAHADA